jgi:uncharacterized membrane protein YccC
MHRIAVAAAGRLACARKVSHTAGRADRIEQRHRRERRPPTGVLFSSKCFVAAIIAYAIALQMDLDRPYWAVMTTYLVAQPFAGAVVSKSLYRIAGTLIGAAMAVFLIPPLVDAQPLLVLALSGWLGLCVYVALLDRTPRSYVFLLSGYTVAIIGFPSVDAAQTIFDTAAVRAQEIFIGIASAGLVHSLLFPATVGKRLRDRVETILVDVEGWSADALSGRPEAARHADRRRLALDIHQLHHLRTHFAFEAGVRPRQLRAVLGLQERLGRLLPLAEAVKDRVGALSAEGDLPPAVCALIAATRAWLSEEPDPVDGRDRAGQLIAEASALEPAVGADLRWRDCLLLNLLRGLRDLVSVHDTCRRLALQLRDDVRAEVDFRGVATKQPSLHRDHGSALRAALGTFATVLLGSAMWIATGWPDGGSAVVFAAVSCALFGSSDSALHSFRFLQGGAVGIGLALVFAFAILPAATDFEMVILALAPILLVAGVFLNNPRTAQMATGFVFSFPAYAGLNGTYDDGFAGIANGAVAQLVGMAFAVLMISLLQAAGSEHAALRLIRSGRRDLARMAGSGDALVEKGWTDRTVDRLALLAPRLVASDQDLSRTEEALIADLQVGIAISDLRRAWAGKSVRGRAIVRPVLAALADHYGALGSGRSDEPTEDLRESVDRAMARLARLPRGTVSPAGMVALTALRRTLHGDAGTWAISAPVAATRPVPEDVELMAA